MRFSIAAFVACVATVQAFRDTSPFLMFSNKAFPTTLKGVSRAQLQTSTEVLKAAKEFLAACESEKYYIISQPQVTASTLAQSSPHLHEALYHESVKSNLVVSEVVGLKEDDREELVNFVKEKCGAEVSQKFVEAGRYADRDVVAAVWEPMIGGWTESEKKLGQSDPVLQHNVLKDIRKFYSYTFVLLSTPLTEMEAKDEIPVYEAAFNDPVHMDLKRNLYIKEDNSTRATDNRPLFEKYQFLTPGLFMGILVGLILLSILSVGLSAISSLQVSYAAFDKEMGPVAQKKVQ